MVFHCSSKLQGAGRRPWARLLAKAVLGKQQQLQGWLPVLGHTWKVVWWQGRGYNGDIVCPERSTGSKKACLVSTGIVLVLKEFG